MLIVLIVLVCYYYYFFCLYVFNCVCETLLGVILFPLFVYFIVFFL